jgi:hypothetical protein
MTEHDVDALVAQLDERGERWSLYRAALGHWVVSMGDGRDDPAARSVDGQTIGEALAAAVAKPRLPVIPRRPEPLGYLTIRKATAGDPWWVEQDGHYVTGTRTRKAAQEYIDRAQQRHAQAQEAWLREHGHFVDTHVEGVDFYWAKW